MYWGAVVIRPTGGLPRQPHREPAAAAHLDLDDVGRRRRPGLAIELPIVGTEAAEDWTVPCADFSSPLGQGRAGIPVPLFNLVYHDAIIRPYAPANLHGLLNGGLPQVGVAALTGAEGEKTLQQVRQMAALHERVALLEMTRHEFLRLDANHRVERTTFADGTTVTVDWEKGTAEVR